MAQNKAKIVGAGIAGLSALVFLLVAVSIFPTRTQDVFGQLNDAKDKLTLAQLVVSFFGFIGAISAFGFAIFQYRKSAKWKKLEFIANEVKEFESDPVIRNALLMIDWGERKINLDPVSGVEESDLITVEREDQWKALLPHPLKNRKNYPNYQSTKFGGGGLENSRAVKEGKNAPRFRPEEAKIRDTYDVFLTRLDRFYTFIDAKLIDAEDLHPFIKYWLDAITENTEPENDAEWRCTLLSYIIFYKYSGVKLLLEDYKKKDINPDGEIYQDIMKSMQNKALAKDLFEQCKKSMS
jgi:hypothetical protein